MSFDGFDWSPMRAGSNFEVPEIRLVEDFSWKPLATGKSKKLYERAVARAFYTACATVLGKRHAGIRYDADVSWEADERLYQRTSYGA